jgi:hypothetical protein
MRSMWSKHSSMAACPSGALLCLLLHTVASLTGLVFDLSVDIPAKTSADCIAVSGCCFLRRACTLDSHACIRNLSRHALCSYHTDPSGTYVKYRCMAIGSGSEGAQTALQEHYKPDMSLADAEVLALSTLKQVMEEQVRLWGGG